MSRAVHAFQARRAWQQGTPQRSAACQYAAQRRLGFAWLRFAAPLEREFREGFFALNVLRVRLASMLGLCGIAGFILLDAWQARLMTPLAVDVLLFVALPGCAIATATSFARDSSTTMQRLLVLCAVLISLADVGAVLASRAERGWFPYESVLLVTLYAYFLAGLLYRQALACGALIALVYFVGRRYVPDGPYPVGYEGYYLFIANTIGWIGLYFFEYHQRLSFLLERELGQRALLDGLTGTLNRTAIRKHLNMMWRQAQRDGRSVALMLVDIDHFKAINDQRGHLVGDTCLRTVAEVLGGCGRRALDAVGRFGGDEFLVAWFDVDQAGFEHVCTLVRERIAQAQVAGAGDLALQVSAGAVLAWPRPEHNAVDALRLADSKLYEAKRSGRGSVLAEELWGEGSTLQLVKSA
jgi:diguanylate cyclase (GGDEF)-like protein